MEYTSSEKKAIEKAIARYNFIKMGDDGVVELFADHHMLNTLRTCEAKFDVEILQNTIPKGRIWPLEFGIFFHQCMEWFDEAEDKNFLGTWNQPFVIPAATAIKWQIDIFSEDCTELDVHEVKDGIEQPTQRVPFLIYKSINHVTWIARCRNFWEMNNLNSPEFNDLPGYKELNGWQGAMSLLMQYWELYGQGKERMRTVGNELCFGKAKEVPILENPNLYPWAPFRCYLTGRIDRVVDNGHSIGPMDRKTHRYLSGKELDKYKPHDAFMGYVYALQRIIPDIPNTENRKVDSVIVDMIQLKEVTDKAKNKTRFLRGQRQYYPTEILEFVNRQISSFTMIWQILIWGRAPQWNTSSCHNQFFRNCPYKTLHEQSPLGRDSVLKSFYQQREKPWNPYPTKDDKNLIQIMDAVE